MTKRSSKKVAKKKTVGSARPLKAKTKAASDKAGRNTKTTASKATKKTAGTKRPKSKVAASKKSSPRAKNKGDSSVTKRLPKVGQKVVWHALPGDVTGVVKRVLTADTVYKGKKIRASPNDPRLELVSSHSGKICYHKPDNVRPA